jgi:hypothetical protein
MKTEESFDLTSMDEYYATYPEVFDEYFQFHCPRTEERLTSALKRYPKQVDDMRKVVNQLPTIIAEVLEQVSTHLEFTLDLEFYLLVGGFGSNAYVNRRIKGNVYFAVEKLSSDPNHLRVIVAHELGHIYHNILLDRANIDWPSLVWDDGTTSLYREGVATYISQQAVPGLSEAIYFQYDDSGEDWLKFCKNHHADIVAAFLEDAKEWTFEKEREWFRLSGGKRFGYNRIGYYLGTELVRYFVDQLGEEKTMTLWAGTDLRQTVISWLEKDCQQ